METITITYDSNLTLIAAIVMALIGALIVLELLGIGLAIIATVLTVVAGVCLFILSWLYAIPMEVYRSIKNFDWRIAIPRDHLQEYYADNNFEPIEDDDDDTVRNPDLEHNRD